MARKANIYITETGLPFSMLQVVRAAGVHKYQNQFCIFCKASSMAEANMKCKEAGLSDRTYQQRYTSIVPAETHDSCKAAEIEIALEPAHKHLVSIETLTAIANGEQPETCLLGGPCAYPISQCADCPRHPADRKENP